MFDLAEAQPKSWNVSYQKHPKEANVYLTGLRRDSFVQYDVIFEDLW